MMEMQNTPAAVIIGGDHRMAHTAKVLSDAGFAVTFWGRDSGTSPPISVESAVRSASLAVLPIPVTRDGVHLSAPLSPSLITLAEVVWALRPEQTVASGTLPPAIAEAIRGKGCAIYDYQADERFALCNALATAEGAVSMAINESPDLLAGASCAVLGFGRIAKQLCRLLAAMGANVTALARKEDDRTLASTLGYGGHPLTEAESVLPKVALIFNTIPKRLFDFSTMGLAPDTAVIDLAPIYESAESPRVIRGAALPAKYAPRFSGQLIGECILAHLDKKEEAV